MTFSTEQASERAVQALRARGFDSVQVTVSQTERCELNLAQNEPSLLRREVDTGLRDGVTTAEAQRVKDLERENKELRRANEILKLASAFFAQAEPGRRLKY